MSQNRTPSDAELDVLKAFWRDGDLSAREVQDRIGGRPGLDRIDDPHGAGADADQGPAQPSRRPRYGRLFDAPAQGGGDRWPDASSGGHAGDRRGASRRRLFRQPDSGCRRHRRPRCGAERHGMDRRTRHEPGRADRPFAGGSIAVAVLAGLAATGFERLCADPGLRERVWALALYLPVLPPVVVGGRAADARAGPSRPVATGPPRSSSAAPDSSCVVDPVAAGPSPDWGLVAGFALGLAVVLSAVAARFAGAGATARLRRLVARAVPAAAEASGCGCGGGAAARRSPSPRSAPRPRGPDALLTGLSRPLLILPDVLWPRAPDSPAARAVIAHELAHLKRGDHRAVWLEEGLLALLAVNPVLPLIRARRAAAREEACDAVALTGAEPPRVAPMPRA